MTDIDVDQPQPANHELSRIDAALDRRRAGGIAVDRWAGLTFSEYREAIEFAKLMAQARNSVPAYLKSNAGDCLAIVTQSLRWRLEPYWVAQHSYVARAESMITYDAAVHAAIVLSSGLLKGRPRYTYAGEGEERTCTVSATYVGETEPHEYTTPPLRQIRPPPSDKGGVKGSPLWLRDPDQQLGYYAIRNWGRRYAPELLGGVYTPDEFENATQEAPIDVTPSPNLLARLPGRMEGQGFQPNIVDPTLEPEPAPAREAPRKPKDELPAPPEAPAAPEPEKPASEAPNGNATAYPESAPEYLAYASAWIRAAVDPDQISYRWQAEESVRKAVKVTPAERKRLESMVEAAIAKVSKARK